MKDRQYYIDNVVSFVNEYFPNSLGIMLSGSFVSNYFNETSDLDILLISNLYRSVFTESYDYNNLKMQTIVLPLYDLDNIMYDGVVQGNGAYISMLQKGIILKDKDYLFKKLKKRASDLYVQGQREMTKFELDSLRSIITSRLEDIEGNDDFYDNVFTFIDLYNYILLLYFKTNKLWNFTGKAASRELKESNPSFRNNLVDSIKGFIIEGDKKSLINFTNEYLQKVGGELHFFSTRSYLEKINDDQLIVFITDNGNIAMKERLLYLSEKFNQFISKQIPDLFYISFIHPSKRIYKSGLYIICYYPKIKIKEHLLPLVELFHYNLSNSLFADITNNIYYPYQLNPIELFGDRNMQILIVGYLKLIHKTYNSYINIGNMDINTYCINTLIHFKFLCFFKNNNNSWHNFLKNIYDITIKSDNREFLPSEIVNYYSKLKDNICKKKYEENKDYFKNNLSSINHKVLDILLQIEERYNAHPTNYILPEETVSNNKGFCFFLFKFIEIILDVLCATDKLLIIYSVEKLT
jgi:predicted nucleotidyltransferase